MSILVIDATDMPVEELACLLRAEIAPEPKAATIDTLLVLAEQILQFGPKYGAAFNTPG